MDTPFEGVVFLTSERVAQLMSECETKELELGAVFAFLARLTLWLPEAATPDAGGVFMSPTASRLCPTGSWSSAPTSTTTVRSSSSRMRIKRWVT